MEKENIHQQTEPVKKQQLYKEDRFQVMQLSLKTGAELKPHTSPTDAFLLVLEGKLLFFIHDKEHHLKKGDTFTFKAGEQHAVQALTDVSFLLIK